MMKDSLHPFLSPLKDKRIPWLSVCHATSHLLRLQFEPVGLHFDVEPSSDVQKLVILVRRGPRPEEGDPWSTVGDVSSHFPSGRLKEDLVTVQQWDLPWRWVFPTVEIWHEWAALAWASHALSYPLRLRGFERGPAFGCSLEEESLDIRRLGLPRSRTVKLFDWNGVYVEDVLRTLQLPGELP